MCSDGEGSRTLLFRSHFPPVALPMPSLVHRIVVGGLQSQVTRLTVELLNVAGIPAQAVGSLIRLSNCTVGVDEACSGIRSLQSTLMATLFIGHLILARRSARWMLVMFGSCPGGLWESDPRVFFELYRVGTRLEIIGIHARRRRLVNSPFYGRWCGLIGIRFGPIGAAISTS